MNAGNLGSVICGATVLLMITACAGTTSGERNSEATPGNGVAEPGADETLGLRPTGIDRTARWGTTCVCDCFDRNNNATLFSNNTCWAGYRYTVASAAEATQCAGMNNEACSGYKKIFSVLVPEDGEEPPPPTCEGPSNGTFANCKLETIWITPQQKLPPMAQLLESVQ